MYEIPIWLLYRDSFKLFNIWQKGLTTPENDLRYQKLKINEMSILQDFFNELANVVHDKRLFSSQGTPIENTIASFRTAFENVSKFILFI